MLIWGGQSIFDKFKSEDILMAFFPCIMFSDQQIINYRCKNYRQQKWTLKQKMEYDLKMHDKLNYFYGLITKLVIVCIDRNLKLIIENPCNQGNTHYLSNYWGFDSQVKDMNRMLNGDNRVKPTQYWFLNCKPKNNYVFDKLEKVEQKRHRESSGIERSMMHPQYARRFIKKYIIDYDINKDQDEQENNIFSYFNGVKNDIV